jgi:hypothetical protein
VTVKVLFDPEKLDMTHPPWDVQSTPRSEKESVVVFSEIVSCIEVDEFGPKADVEFQDTVGAVRSTTIVSDCDAVDSPLTPVAFAVTDLVPAVTVSN